jgi:hypothetical protein
MKNYALTNRFCQLALTLMLLVGLTLGAQPAAPAQATPVLEQANAPRNVTWTGAGNDGRWRNPANWAGQHAPGVRDRVRLTGAQAVWFDAASPIAGLVLDANFSGVLYLARPLDVTGELVIAGGQLVQGTQPVRVAALTQTGGEIVGGSAPPPLGGGVSDEFRQYFEDFCVHWSPIIQAQHDGVLDLGSLSQDDRELLQRSNVPAMLA